jgi:translation initiation factor 3 subunit A
MDRADSGRGSDRDAKDSNGPAPEPLKATGAPGKYVPKFRREG